MKRRAHLLLPIFLLLLVAGCQTTSAPERREILGSWATDDIVGTVIRMTLAETARSVDGAGSWIDGDEARAFVVRGALAIDEVSLHFDFPGAEAVNFQGHFIDDDTMTGTLNGAGLREIAVTFDRQDLIE